MSSTTSSRGNPSMGDILRSVAVIGVIILALWAFGKLFTVTPDSPVRTVDWQTTVEQARPAADFALVAPTALPAGWKATSVRYRPASWHLGVLTDDQDYVGLEQVKLGTQATVERFAEGSTASGEATIAGESWSVRKGPQDRLTFVRREGGLTTLVNGTAPRAEMEDYISSLSAS